MRIWTLMLRVTRFKVKSHNKKLFAWKWNFSQRKIVLFFYSSNMAADVWDACRTRQSQSKSFTKFAKDRCEFLFRKYTHEQTVLSIVSKYDYCRLDEMLSRVLVLYYEKKKRNTCLKVCIIWFLAMRRELCAMQVAVSSLSPVNIHI